jgi:hypothetical protein
LAKRRAQAFLPAFNATLSSSIASPTEPTASKLVENGIDRSRGILFIYNIPKEALF